MKTFDQEFGGLSEEQQETLAALMAYPTKTAAAKGTPYQSRSPLQAPRRART